MRAMSRNEVGASEADILVTAGLAGEAVAAFVTAVSALSSPVARREGEGSSFEADCRDYGSFWRLSTRLLERLTPPARCNAQEQTAAAIILAAARKARTQFLRQHVEAVYDRITARRTRYLRVEDLVAAAAEAVPGLVPTVRQLAAEDGRLQRDRSGAEIDQGLFLSAVLSEEPTGRHLCHAMLLPRPDSFDLLDRFRRDGFIELAGASARRHGKACIVTYANPRFLNAEDQGTLDAMETCVDIALLDDACEVAVLRGAPVEHPKYRGRRIFGAGINLTHLYHGRIPYLWYLRRDLGYVNKIYRGLAMADDAAPDEFGGATVEKAWIAAIEGFAIGGHCQVILVCDQVIAERDAFLTLPARKEGIIPGAANLRLPRFTGDRIARQAILGERRIDCDSPQALLLCDTIVASGTMDAAIDRAIEALTGSGVVSAAGNRRALRIAEEPLDLFRRYMAVYAREQAFCHFSPALISNLERHWNAQNRKP
jgi:thioesterase DpgC